MIFIHQSHFNCHGRLRSTNCLVDSRWAVHLSGFGLQKFRSGEKEDLTEEQLARSKCPYSFSTFNTKLNQLSFLTVDNIWAAPEILREEENTADGTQKGDVYSFGIILHEIFGRKGPFGDELIDPISES